LSGRSVERAPLLPKASPLPLVRPSARVTPCFAVL
jgi:hypothetical protein